MRLHVQDPAARPLVEALYRQVWEDIARHFHAPSRQWAGPHSRCYSTLLKTSALALLQRASGGALDWGVDHPSISEQRLPLPCPPDLLPLFKTLDAPREVVKTYLKAEPPVVGTTWLEPAFALGSASRGEFWNQRRGAVAYWGTPQAPAYLHVRFLRDGYDFSDAQLFTAQRRGDLLAAVNFGTDGGNTHIGLDRIRNGCFRAKDLRLRFEFGGSAASQKPAAPGTLLEAAALRFGELRIGIAAPACAVGDLRPRWESGQDKDQAWLDLVLYAGEETSFDLARLKTAALGFALRLATRDAPPPQPAHTWSVDRLTLSWDALRVSVPVRPDKVSVLQRAVTY